MASESVITDDLAARCKRIRRAIIGLSFHSKSAHVGSSLSCVEILASVYQRKSGKPQDATLILSKGHAAMALYATAQEFGELPADVQTNYLKDGTTLWGHPSVSTEHPFIEWSTGSLGHGLPVATGIAYARAKLKSDPRPVIVVLSDGELDEGSNWEAALFGAHHRLDNLVAIVDHNKLQSFGRCDQVIGLEPLVDKWRSFGWSAIRINGHDLSELEKVLARAPSGQPLCVIADTIKGKGLPEYENTLESHYRSITRELFDKYGS